jgi:hypothetical protein
MAVTSAEPDPARLPPGAAATRGDLVDTFNVFMVRDPNGRELRCVLVRRSGLRRNPRHHTVTHRHLLGHAWNPSRRQHGLPLHRRLFPSWPPVRGRLSGRFPCNPDHDRLSAAAA